MMNRLFAKLNHFFISDDPEEVSLHDQLWFYIPMALMMLIVMIVMISTLVTY